MKRALYPAILGAFIVAAVTLAVLAVFIFGRGSFFKQQPRFVVFFPGSVMGLSRGSPVSYHGAPVGSVVDIQVVFQKDERQFHIPVVIELNLDSMQNMGSFSGSRAARQQALLDFGVRAQLITASFVTGQKQVAVDLKPESEIRMTGRKSEYPEIPTLPSPFEQISEKLQRLPIERIAELLEGSLGGIERTVNSPKLEEGLTAAVELLQESRVLARRANEFLADTQARLKASNPEQLAKQIEVVLKQMEQVLTDIGRLTGTGAPLNQTLTEASRAAFELRGLLEYLNRHPEALVQGKKPVSE